ncbi:MAG: Ni/Fe-hydrogenase, b-type cytochrome subunit [Campylobacterales bacterium]|nr:Ni/Fe-hydrogenase, b-type cytochrome subunit [Campylobacterales bacterium]
MIKKHFEFSYWYRVTHWIRAFAILALTLTGFYIAVPFFSPVPNPDPTNFMYALMRFWHIVFGFLLIAVVVGKVYVFLFDPLSKIERDSVKDAYSLQVWIKQLRYYLLIDKHPHTKGIYNPLQFMAYFGVYVSLFIICLTGLILHMHVYHEGIGGFVYGFLRPIEVWVGGLGMVRDIHHITMWFFIVFLPVHIYLAVFNSVHGQTGAMDTIISGYKWDKDHDKEEH